MSWEMAVGISSAVIALSALAFAILEGRRTQQHNKLSVKPYLVFQNNNNITGGIYTVTLANNGLGPARIKNFTMLIDGEIIKDGTDDPIKDAVDTLFSDLPHTLLHSGTMNKDYLMPANEKFIIANVKFMNPKTVDLKIINSRSQRAALIIEYESIYEEKFTFSSDDE